MRMERSCTTQTFKEARGRAGISLHLGEGAGNSTEESWGLQKKREEPLPRRRRRTSREGEEKEQGGAAWDMKRVKKGAGQSGRDTRTNRSGNRKSSENEL